MHSLFSKMIFKISSNHKSQSWGWGRWTEKEQEEDGEDKEGFISFLHHLAIA